MIATVMVMVTKRGLILLLLLSVLSAVGCRTASIYNPRVTFMPREESEVEDAILKGMANQALARRPWIAREEKPGVIIGILNIRVHQAVVRIEYDRSSYSIRLVDSRELLYERKPSGEEVIHKNYNVWIRLLVNDINAYLGVYGSTDGARNEQHTQGSQGAVVAPHMIYDWFAYAYKASAVKKTQR